MDRLIRCITVITFAVSLSFHGFSQGGPVSNNLIVIRGKGVGNATIGMTKSEMDAVLGNSIDDSWFSRLEYRESGILADYDKTTNRVTKITVLFKGYDRFKDFKGMLEDDVRTLPQILTKYGQPLDSSTRTLTSGTTNYLKFDGIAFWLSDGRLTDVAVTPMANVATQKPTPNPDAKKTITDIDCKYLLAFEDCRDILFETKKQDLLNKFGTYENYQQLGFADISFSNIGVINALTFSEGTLGFKPANGIEWNDDLKAVIKQLGVPIDRSKFKNAYGVKTEAVSYADKTLLFEKGKLKFIKFTRPETKFEADVAKFDRDRIANLAESPEAKAKRIASQMETDYNELLDRLDAKIREGLRIVNSERLAIAAGGMFKKAVEDKLDKVRASGISMVDSFSKKYEGKIPSWMVKGILDKWKNGGAIN